MARCYVSSRECSYATTNLLHRLYQSRRLIEGLKLNLFCGRRAAAFMGQTALPLVWAYRHRHSNPESVRSRSTSISSNSPLDGTRRAPSSSEELCKGSHARVEDYCG